MRRLRAGIEAGSLDAVLRDYGQDRGEEPAENPKSLWHKFIFRPKYAARRTPGARFFATREITP